MTGPTGSGKTTSLASMLNWMNHNLDHHVITLEDPIEYYHKHNKCTFNQREIGVDVPSFPEALRRALRMDPDVILVGEMRDLETIEAAIEAIERADFLTVEEKRDILFNNAARFLQLPPSRIEAMHGGKQP